ncbi:DUF1684 domain-containing protein [Siphonobacter sp. SORGH_AS_1065]|uniref:DUF1684 domain-containing protein n=1 Tax=Siphonobacter sp. SORGH_AS_1065 TaxID=3041795 RepID=UPI00278A97C0|nr:DUF1684 domain-containing protein [Siphonobacter sp. SORGH_AS_1065]MDQ1088638.1 uncharacterized protein (DUF1684 family) [Siphonobacter sp. SORGH_AS_1065]
MTYRSIIVLFTVLSLASFTPASEDPAYKAKLEAWHQKRINSLKEENGWLNLAGLFWLKEGDNTVGSVSDNKIVFPAGDQHIGNFQLKNGEVTFTPDAQAEVLMNGEKITATQTIFSDHSRNVPTLQHQSLRWVIIKRGDKYGVRLRDLESEQLKNFHGIERYPVNETYRVKAHLEKPATPTTVSIVNMIGQTSEQPLAGTLVFKLNGKTYRLDATGKGELFIVFGDATNKTETYGSGRFIYVEEPDAEGNTILDFNQAINPPCAFTPYATCPLPLKQNKLAIRIPAGEKRFGDH